jgi:hypothetical protein
VAADPANLGKYIETERTLPEPGASTAVHVSVAVHATPVSETKAKSARKPKK